MTAVELAKLFHESYNKMAPVFGYPAEANWDELPARNQLLLLMVCSEIVGRLAQDSRQLAVVQQGNSQEQGQEEINPDNIWEVMRKDLKAAFAKGYAQGKAKIAEQERLAKQKKTGTGTDGN